MFDETQHLAGYQTHDVVFSGERTRVLLGVRVADGMRVAIKALRATPQTEKTAFAAAQREHEVTERCSGPGVLRVLGLERIGCEPAIVFEHVPGGTLRSRIKPNGCTLDEFFAIATPLARALARVHRARVVHRDIKPDNVLMDAAGAPVLGDFGIATILPRGQHAIFEPGVLQGSLAYMAPEQSGRMNRGVDTRTDLYALGIVLYELLAGAPPFDGNDALALVHAHLTKAPRRLDDLRADVPRALADVIAKLLAKDPDHRYQSARTLAQDLERTAAIARGASADGFLPGADDAPDHLVFSQRLYGREDISVGLRDAFVRAASGHPLLSLLTGPTGIGRSAHAEAIAKFAAERNARVAVGRFVPHRTQEPYSALRDALSALVDALLAESEDVLDEYKERLSTSLGAVGQVAVDLVPALERVLGPQAPLTQLGPAETRHRFLVAVRRLIAGLSTLEQPVVLVFDDLQHADRGSLQVLEAIITEASDEPLFILGTAPDGVCEAGTPLFQWMEAARRAARFVPFVLPKLTRADLTSWLADTLRAKPERAERLAARVEAKTGGNPFFAQQFLRGLEESGALKLDDAGQWSWIDAEIAIAEIPDDLAGIMASELRRVGEDARKLAAIVSCIGGPFEADLATELAAHTSIDVTAAIYELSRAGLLGRVAGTYRFAHASLQDAARQGLDANEQRTVRRRLAALLLDRAGEDFAEQVFAIAQHLQCGYEGDDPHALSPDERRRLFLVYSTAGERALGSTAYDAAAEYLGAAVRVLDDALWRALPDRAFSAELGYGKALFLVAEPERGEEVLSALALRPLPERQAAEAASALVSLLATAGEMTKAVSVAIAALSRLGTRHSMKPSMLLLVLRLVAVSLVLARKSDQELVLAPRTTSDRVEAIATIATAVGPAAFWLNPKLYLTLHLSMLLLNFRRGYTVQASYAFARQALVTAGFFRNFTLAQRLAKISFALNERIPNPQYWPRTQSVVYMTVEGWAKPVRESIPKLVGIARACEEAGDLEYASFSVHTRMNMLWTAGENLRTLREDAREAWRRCGQWGFDDVASVERQTVELVDLLMGERELPEADPISLGPLGGREAKAPLYQGTARGLSVLYLLGRYEDAFRFAEATRDMPKVMPGQVTIPEHQFFHAMAAARLASSKEDGARYLRAFARLKKAVATHARKCPDNNMQRLHLLDAEEARLAGKRDKAIVAYGEAAAHALRHGMPQIVALAHERRGELLLAMGLHEEGELFLAQAYEGYRSWGAHAKTQRMDKQYERLARRRATLSSSDGATATYASTLGAPSSSLAAATHTTTVGHESGAMPSITVGATHDGGHGAASTLTTRGGRTTGTAANGARRAGNALDLGTMLRVTQAISEELTAEGVLRRVLDAALTNAGAERAVLVLRRDGLAIVEAEGRAGGHFAHAPLPLEQSTELPLSVLRVVERSNDCMVLGDACADKRFGKDAYIKRAAVRSVLSVPLLRQGELAGMLYLENNAVSDAFTPDRVELLRVLATQAAISLDNAELYAGLEAKVEERTRALDARTREMRLVLDNVDQGFVTLDRAGVMADERSAVVAQWFGPCRRGATLVDYLRPVAPQTADALAFGWEALLEDFLPFELLLEQLPKRFVAGGKTFELAYRPIFDEPTAEPSGTTFARMLVVLSDVTAQLERERSERRQREILDVFQRIATDRAGVDEFRAEASFIVEAVCAEVTPPIVDLKRMIHTLKGNAATFGFASIADICQALENEMDENPGPPSRAELDELRRRFAEVEATLASLVGTAVRERVELRKGEISDLASALRRGAAPSDAADVLDAWLLEPMDVRLRRIGEQVRRLARSLGKGDVLVVEEGNGLRLDAEGWAPFWNALVHVVRNAVDHGLEAPEERAEAGKVEPPKVVLKTFVEAGQLVVEVSDNGRGVAWSKLSEKARAHGLPAETHEDLVAALFADGLSTRDEVTSVSGRGVGAGAVRSECELRGGHVEVRSEAGVGTSFRFCFPESALRGRGLRAARPSALPSRRPSAPPPRDSVRLSA
jgi:predicted ATPase/HPt (histidine-containing phosphotransfer) domain-containing protein/two-component sensor histidine kinase